MNCPACQEPSFEKEFDLKDYFLTQEMFHVEQCQNCGLRHTAPEPSSSALDRYYDSPDYLSHGADQQGIFARAYRIAKGYNLSTKSNLLKSLNKEGSLLDYGCGTADLIAHCK